MSNRIIAGIILALVFLGGWWLIARNASNGMTGEEGGKMAETEQQESTPAGSNETTTGSVLGPIAEDVPTVAGSHETLDVEDQPAGTSVMVKSATLVQTGWIAVRDESGRTLGAGRFDAGDHADVEVPLLRGTTAGERYQVLIYVDDGDREFDLHKDVLVTSADGSVAGDLFNAQ